MPAASEIEVATAERKLLLMNGYCPIPAIGKRPSLKEWQNLIVSEADIDAWQSTHPTSINTGILCGSVSAVDIDIRDPEAAAAVEAMLWDLLGTRSLIRFGMAPKRAAIFRTDRPFRKLVTAIFIGPNGIEHKTEILGLGQQIIISGIHPDTGRPYAWHGGAPSTVPYADLPELTEHQAREIIGKAEGIMRAQPGWIEKKKPAKANGATPPPPPPPGHNPEFAALYGSRGQAYAIAALQGAAAEVAGLAVGGRNDRVNALAFRFGTMVARGWLDRSIVADVLFDAAVACGLVRDDGAHQTRSTIASGLGKGMLQPHPDLADDDTSSAGTAAAEPPESPELNEWDAGDDLGPIPPRAWLLGNMFCRSYASALLAGGGTGKTALRMVQYLALASGRPLSGEHVFERTRVLIVSLEDDVHELRRRLEAAMQHHKVERDDIKGWLFLAAPGRAGGKIMTIDPFGRPAVGGLVAKLSRTITSRKIDLVALDPFIKCHGVPENDNNMIDAVVQALTELAVEHNIAVDTPHHISKGASDPGNADRGRGASASKDAWRLVYTMSPMTIEEAKAFGLSEAMRRSLVRVDSGKVNIAPPMTEARWFRIIGISIGNGGGLYPNGDEVQTVVPWKPPETFAGLNSVGLNLILDEIEAGLPDGSRFSDAPSATGRAAWRIIEKHCPTKPEAICRDIIKSWLKSGLLISRDYSNPATRKLAMGLYVDNEKRPS
jgi:hypothetical protein